MNHTVLDYAMDIAMDWRRHPVGWRISLGRSCYSSCYVAKFATSVLHKHQNSQSIKLKIAYPTKTVNSIAKKRFSNSLCIKTQFQLCLHFRLFRRHGCPADWHQLLHRAGSRQVAPSDSRHHHQEVVDHEEEQSWNRAAIDTECEKTKKSKDSRHRQSESGGSWYQTSTNRMQSILKRSPKLYY